MAEIVGIAVFAAVITSSPFFIPRALREINSASVPLLTAKPYCPLYFLIKSFSNFNNSLPKKIVPLLIDLSIFYSNSVLIFLYSLLYVQNLIINYFSKFIYIHGYINFSFIT